MVPQNCSELEKIVQILYAGDQSGINGSLKDDEYLVKMMDYVLSNDLELIEQGVSWLEEDFNRNEKEYADVRGSIAILIAYASCRLEDQQQALHYAKVAKIQFQEDPNLWNQALSFWFLGIVYKNNGYIKEAESVLRIAKELLEKHIETFRKYNYTSRELCFEYILRIEQEIGNLSAHAPLSSPPPSENKETKNQSRWFKRELNQSSPSQTLGFDATPMTTTGFIIDGIKLDPKKHSDKTRSSSSERRESSRSSSSTARSSFHIIIPVDIQALMNPERASEALDAKFYNQLKKYNGWEEDRGSANKDESAINHQPAYKPSSFTERFPIYGGATAGPKGKVTFEAPTDVNDVTEDHQVEFFGVKYNIYSTKENDLQISISNTKIYGWLMIAGESMNKASPIPIDNRDYVLFYKINDLKSCIDKIVVATKPELDEQYPTLIVKRLIAKIPKSKNWGEEKKKYYLHSESSMDKYKDDIEFTEKNQLIGEIIAVAKRVI